MSARDGSDTDAESSPVAGIVAVLLAWLVPGAGHLYLGRRRRAIAFFCIVVVATLCGSACSTAISIESSRASPCRSSAPSPPWAPGSLYLVLRFVVGHVGDIVASGYEYGTAFLLTAGLMNWLLVLDCWDIVLGRKE